MTEEESALWEPIKIEDGHKTQRCAAVNPRLARLMVQGGQQISDLVEIWRPHLTTLTALRVYYGHDAEPGWLDRLAESLSRVKAKAPSQAKKNQHDTNYRRKHNLPGDWLPED